MCGVDDARGIELRLFMVSDLFLLFIFTSNTTLSCIFRKMCASNNGRIIRFYERTSLTGLRNAISPSPRIVYLIVHLIVHLSYLFGDC